MKCHTEAIASAMKETFIHSLNGGEITIVVPTKCFIFQNISLVYHELRANQRSCQENAKNKTAISSEMKMAIDGFHLGLCKEKRLVVNVLQMTTLCIVGHLNMPIVFFCRNVLGSIARHQKTLPYSRYMNITKAAQQILLRLCDHFIFKSYVGSLYKRFISTYG